MNQTSKTPGSGAGRSALIYNVVIIALAILSVLILSCLYRKNDFFRSLPRLLLSRTC